MHFSVAVLTREGDYDEVADLLAPYNEDICVAPYVYKTKAELIERRKEYQKYAEKYCSEADDKEKTTKKYEYCRQLLGKSDEELYNLVVEAYSPENFNANGDLLSRCNPDAKWDYWSIGGRWSNEDNTLPIKDIDWDSFSLTYAVVTPDGVWHAPGEMGWFSSTETDEEYEKWKKEYRDFIIKYSDYYLTIVDCHI